MEESHSDNYIITLYQSLKDKTTEFEFNTIFNLEFDNFDFNNKEYIKIEYNYIIQELSYLKLLSNNSTSS